jgi:hypothetical protein
MDKLFKVGGVSCLKGQFKVRFANDMIRVKNLTKGGHTHVELLEMPEGKTKGQVVTFLKTTELYNNAEYRAVIDAADDKYNGVAVVKTSKAKAVKPSLEAIKARAIAQEVMGE